jgi:catechol 2,3-dioxygenase-like lactoylglutathione lyase family enzyme
MPDFEILSTNHTSFTVSSLDRAVALFRDGFGFTVTSRAPRDPKTIEHIVGVAGADIEVAYVRGPGHAIELIEYKGPRDKGKVVARPCDTGFAHIAFDVRNLEAVVAAVAPYGLKPVAPPLTLTQGGPNAGAKIVYLRDPDGITIELIEKPSRG